MGRLIRATVAACLILGAGAPKLAAQVTVTIGTPTLNSRNLGPPVAPNIATEPRLKLAIGELRNGAGTFKVSADARTDYFSLVQDAAQVLVHAMNGYTPDIILRPPVPMGEYGNVSTAAMSADGSRVAVSWASNDTASIFIFDRASGAIAGRLDGLVDTVIDLRFSPDGTKIAATLSTGGVQLFDTRRGVEIGRDLNYGGRAYSVDFSPNGRLLLTGCSDRLIRAYEVSANGLRFIRSQIAGSNLFKTAPASVRFSPNGQLLAVGFDQGPVVEIWDASTLTKISDLNTIGFTSNAWDVMWSPDGKRVYAPSVNGKGEFKIRVWNAGRSTIPKDEGFNILSHAEDRHVDGHDTISGYLPLADGGLMVFTQRDARGLFDPTGQLTWQIDAHPVRFQNLVLRIDHPIVSRLSPDGKTVQFTFDGYKDAEVFDTVQRRVVPDPGTLSDPISKNSFGLDVNITGIFGLSDPNKRATMNGVQLEMPAKEFATRYAVSPTGDRVAVSTSGAVRMYARDGRLIWSQPGGGYSVNISKDGRLVVVDSTAISWLRTSDGAPLLFFLPNADHSRWVMWTPSGYFAASDGGDDLVEWVVNRGLNQAPDIYPLSRFADEMRRPDIVSRVLDTLDEGQAVDLANAAAGRTSKPLIEPELSSQPAATAAAKISGRKSQGHVTTLASHRPPPSTVAINENTHITPALVSELLPPKLVATQEPATFSSDTVTLHYQVRTPESAPMIGEPRVLVDGQWQSRSRAASQVGGNIRTLVVTNLPPKDTHVQLYADNRNGTSLPLDIPLKWVAGGAQTASRAATTHKPHLFVLAIGISAYTRPELRLTFADHDADQFVSAMNSQRGRAYESVESKLLVNGQATRDAVANGLVWLQSVQAAGDVGVLFLSGHGFDTSDGDYFFAPADFDPNRPRDSGINYRLIRDALVRFEGKGNRAIFLIDTCYSGGTLGPNTTASNGQEFGNTLTSAQFSMVGMTSSGREQLSLEKVDWGDGAFTKALLEGIAEARADATHSGEITMLGLGSYVSQRVRDLTKKAQTPVFMAPNGLQDFDIAQH